MYQEEDLLPISGLQHLNFCERQWALIHMEQEWAENVLTVEGKQLHLHVHEQGAESRGPFRLVRGLQLRSLELGLFGVADLVEFHSTSSGQIPFPVEYKRGRKRYDRSDELQLCAQAMCLEEMLQIAVPEGAVYYGQPRRRQRISLDASLRDGVRRLCERARQLYEEKRLPPPVHAHHCENCSLLSVCIPELSGKDRSKAYVDDIVRNIAEGMS
jgi:CRISPR-associated exonuclease Cas4